MQNTHAAAAEYWGACAALSAADEGLHAGAIATLIRLALNEPDRVGGLAAELLMERFGARVMMGRGAKSL